MKVEIIRPSGFCGGVKNAFNIVAKAKKEHPHKEIYILGLLVHNELILDYLTKEGVKTIYSIDEIKEGNVLIFSAHGHDEKLEEIAKKKNLVIYDATCFKVAANMNRIKKEINEGKEVIYIGVKGHAECEACLSISDKVHLYDIKSGIDYLSLKDNDYVVTNQTSLNINSLNKIHQEIKSHFPNATFVDEICDATRIRQEIVKNLDDSYDYFIVAGDTKSSNSTRLHEIFKETHPGVASQMVNSVEELDIETIKNKKSIAIMSGTSTPEFLIDAIYNKLINL